MITFLGEKKMNLLNLLPHTNIRLSILINNFMSILQMKNFSSKEITFLGNSKLCMFY
jgi:hypothetical protein